MLANGLRWPVSILMLMSACILCSYHLSSQAEELTIFDVRKTLPMHDEEKVFRDFYVNGGTEQGLRPGMVVTVTRRVTLYDSYQNKSPGDLMVDVARVKIIHVQKGLSVARMHSDFSRSKIPLLEDDFVMVGDKLDLHTAMMDKKKAGGGKRDPNQTPASPPPQKPSQPQQGAPSKEPSPSVEQEMALGGEWFRPSLLSAHLISWI